MKLLFSVPSGYHIRELVLPLRRHLSANADITEVHIVTPAGSISARAFPEFGKKFIFHENPKDDAGHTELFNQINPDRVITNTVGHDELDEPIIRIAKEIGIETVTFIASWDNVWKIERLLQSNIPIALADKYIVWNTMMRNHLMRLFPSILIGRIAVIGSPRMDYFFDTEKIASKVDVYKELGFDDLSRPFIHVATTELYPMEYIVQEIRRGITAKEIPNNPYIYASVHPGGDISKYKHFENYGVTVRYSPGRKDDISLKSFRYSPTEKDIYMLLGIFKSAGVVVNHSSTVALESIIADVPVINIKYGIKYDWWNWYRCMVYRDFKEHYADLVSDMATDVVTDRKLLTSSVKKALEHPEEKHENRVRTVRKIMTNIEGTASMQALGFIMGV